MEGKNWSEFEEYKCKLENRCNKLLLDSKKKNLQWKDEKNQQKNLKI